MSNRKLWYIKSSLKAVTGFNACSSTAYKARRPERCPGRNCRGRLQGSSAFAGRVGARCPECRGKRRPGSPGKAPARFRCRSDRSPRVRAADTAPRRCRPVRRGCSRGGQQVGVQQRRVDNRRQVIDAHPAEQLQRDHIRGDGGEQPGEQIAILSTPAAHRDDGASRARTG